MNSMDCFSFDQSLCDFVDGNLAKNEQAKCDEHLKQCNQCQGKTDHIKKICAAISSIPKIPLPATLRSAPMNHQPVRAEAGGPRPGPNDKAKGNWGKAPWYIRSGVEGMGITLVVLIIIGTVPRLRSWYETSLEKRLESFNLADFISSQFDSDESAENSDLKIAKSTSVPISDSTSAVDEFSGEEEEEEDVKPSKNKKDRPLRLGNSEVVRFSISTDQPLEFRNKVIQALQDVGVSKDTNGFGGIKAPGGIQFDLIINTSMIAPLQKQLQKLAGSMPKAVSKSGQTENREAFTWYKVRSRRNIPAGKTRVVIWLSQY